jgi:hypothetical protein
MSELISRAFFTASLYLSVIALVSSYWEEITSKLSCSLIVAPAVFIKVLTSTKSISKTILFKLFS